MTYFSELIHNLMLISAMTAWAVAQLIKGFLIFLREHRMSWERFTGSGGMPSSHSSTVCALTTSAALRYGFSSGIFAISAIMSIIVIYDARGVRREAGRHGQMLNELQTYLQKHTAPLSRTEDFDELVGHSPLEVAVGMVVGVLVSLGMSRFI